MGRRRRLRRITSGVLVGASALVVGIWVPLAAGLTGPTVQIITPRDHAVYRRGTTILARYTCRGPTGTQALTCAGTAPIGAPIDTSTVGTFTFSVIASNAYGPPVTTRSTYRVVWNISVPCRHSIRITLTDLARARQAAHHLAVRLGTISPRLALRLAKRILTDETSAEASLPEAGNICTAGDGPTVLALMRSKISSRIEREILLIRLVKNHLVLSAGSNRTVSGATRHQLQSVVNEALTLSTDGISAGL